MKVVSFLIMSVSLAGTFGQQATKLLRIPKIYNTLISSDEQLLPSLAYKAVSPVIKSVAPGPHYPYAPVVNIVEHQPVLIPPQHSYQNQFEQDPQVPVYEQQGVYNDLVSSLLALNQSLTMTESGAVTPEEPSNRKAKKERFADIRNNRNRLPGIPDVPPPPLPNRIKQEEKHEEPTSGQDYPPPAIGPI